MFTATLFTIAQYVNNLNIHQRMNRDDVAHIYNGYYTATKRNKIGSSVKTWMDLDTAFRVK